MDFKALRHHMVSVRARIIVLRDDRLDRSWSVCIKPFPICRYQVAQSFYAKVMGQSPSSVANDNRPVETVS